MDSESFAASQAESPEAMTKPHIERFKFTGKGGEYFGIWIVNILLTILTLGIYSAWAKVRNKQYFYGNTTLEGASFEYTATPWQILRGRLIAIVLLALYLFASSFLPLIGLILALLLFLASPWIIMKSLAFNANYSLYRGIRFTFNQNLIDAVKTFLLIPILSILPAILVFVGTITFMGTYSTGSGGDSLPLFFAGYVAFLLLLFLAYPFIIYVANRYVVSNHGFGNKSFKFRLDTPKPLFSIYLKALGLGIACIFLGGLIAAVLLGTGFDFAAIQAGDTSGLGANALFSIVLLYLVFGCLYAFILAFIKARTYNLIYQKTMVGNHKLRAKMKATDLTVLYVTNTLGIALTLGLFIPWAKVRTARFLANNTALQVFGDLSSFVATQTEYQSAIGEQIGEVFDLDIAL